MKDVCSRELRDLNHIYKETEGIYTRYAAAQGISTTTLCMMYSIYTESGACTQSQLVADWGIPMQTVNSCLKAMERSGIVRMDYAEGNRKTKYITPTEAGETIIQKIVAPLIEAENRALAGLDAEERRLLLTLNRKHSGLLQSYLLGL